MIETYKNQAGEDCVLITNEDGSTTSMLQSSYDELKANEAKAK
jgi:hypothetical protein